MRHFEADVAKVVELERRKIRMGQKHRSTDQLVAHLDEIRRAVVGQISGRNKVDPFWKRNAEKLSRSTVGKKEQRPRMSSKSPPTTMKRKLQVGGVSGPVRRALPRGNVGWLGAAAQHRNV